MCSSDLVALNPLRFDDYACTIANVNQVSVCDYREGVEVVTYSLSRGR